MHPTFYIGQKVTVNEFTDCFRKHHAAQPDMTVVEIEKIEPGSIPSYYRIKAVGENGKGYLKAAERFFTAQ